VRSRGMIGGRRLRWMVGVAVLAIALSGSFAASARADTLTNCVSDPGVFFKVCMKMYYNLDVVNNQRYVDAYKYTAVFSRIAPGATLNNADVHIGVFGPKEGGGIQTGIAHEHTFSTITLGNTYSWSPTWSPLYIDIDSAWAFQCMNASATVHRNGTNESWSLNPTWENVCKGSPQFPNFWANR